MLSFEDTIFVRLSLEGNRHLFLIVILQKASGIRSLEAPPLGLSAMPSWLDPSPYVQGEGIFQAEVAQPC